MANDSKQDKTMVHTKRSSRALKHVRMVINANTGTLGIIRRNKYKDLNRATTENRIDRDGQQEKGCVSKVSFISSFFVHLVFPILISLCTSIRWKRVSSIPMSSIEQGQYSASLKNEEYRVSFDPCCDAVPKRRAKCRQRSKPGIEAGSMVVLLCICFCW